MKKQQSQVQTIQRTVPSRNATQDNGNINISGNAVAGFAFNTLGPFVISYDRIKKMAVWKATFVSEHLNTDESQLTKCFALVVCFACSSLGNSS